jgi:hypothetical protein
MAFQIMKTRYFRKKLLLFFLIFATSDIFSQRVDSTSFRLYPRHSFYSFEKSAEFLLHVPDNMRYTEMSVELLIKDKIITSWKGKPGKNILSLKSILNQAPSVNEVVSRIAVTGKPGLNYKSTTKLVVLQYKPNEVKTDNLTGGVIVNKRVFFPFGFYCYSPVYPTLPEEEVVKGFNMISPYQKILPETLAERKFYMDRCAQLGMKVHYNLLSVSGGGGVGSKIEGISDSDKRQRMIEEIKTFMDHPALLAWYISDEPYSFKIPPETLEEIYKTVKETDPWHPVTMVFNAPFIAAKKYANALDIVMADPYPVPVKPVTQAGDAAAQLKAEFAGKKPVWIVPQAFGGGEWWEREPTLQEMRSMTWQAIINGATGIQYFVRQGMNFFPKSAASWGECGRMATEVAELTPWILSDEEPLPVESLSTNIIAASRLHKGKLMIMAVNKINAPLPSSFRIKGLSSGKARVLFENRTVSFSGGIIKDQMAPFGSQVYMIEVEGVEKVEGVEGVEEVEGTGKQGMIVSKNLIVDPGFEDLTAPGLPSACYARPGGDRGATYFLDTREHFEGDHSLRLITPVINKSAAIRFFPVSVKAGSTYAISLWAKADPEQRFPVIPVSDNTAKKADNELPQYTEVLLGEFSRARFVPDSQWREYVTFVTIPTDTTKTVRTNLILKMPGQGVGWFDMVKVMEEK